MSKREINLMSDTQQALVKMGANMRKARLRRNLNAEYIAEQANISTDTLSSIEKGAPTVSIGAYAAVLAVLELDKDIQLVALDEEGKKRFWEQNLYPRERASKKKYQHVFFACCSNCRKKCDSSKVVVANFATTSL